MKPISLEVGKHFAWIAEEVIVYEVHNSLASKFITVTSRILVKNSTSLPFELRCSPPTPQIASRAPPRKVDEEVHVVIRTLSLLSSFLFMLSALIVSEPNETYAVPFHQAHNSHLHFRPQGFGYGYSAEGLSTKLLATGSTLTGISHHSSDRPSLFSHVDSRKFDSASCYGGNSIVFFHHHRQSHS